MLRFADLPDFVLGPLAGRSDADWYRAPTGRWNTAQVVEHLALGLEWSATGFAERRARDPMVRRPLTFVQRAARLVVMRLGWIPSGFEAPSRAVPAPHVERASAEAHFRRGVAQMLDLAGLLLPARAHDLFVKHPFFGDLALPEWMEFHVRHARHHVRQIRRRVSG